MTDITEAKKIVLAEYERERDELNALIGRLRRELGMDAASTTESASEAASRVVVSQVVSGINLEEIVTPGDFFGMTQVAAAREFCTAAQETTSKPRRHRRRSLSRQGNRFHRLRTLQI